MNLYGEIFTDFYDRHFGDYAEKAAPFLLRFLARLPETLRRLSVLDLGCGTGRLALRFLEAGYSFVGLDQSPHMLWMAENRCWRYVAAHRGRFLQEDISQFQIGSPFGLVLSTYNVLNHLESPERLRGCFRSVRRCLADGGRFAFDFQTWSGLKEWASRESAQWKAERIECSGELNEVNRTAAMHLKGEVEGKPFEEKILNYTYPMAEVAHWLKEEGFQKSDFFRITDMLNPLEDPEKENRVFVLAG